MKLNIRDMLDGYIENDIEINTKKVVSTDRIKEITMKRINRTNKSNFHIKRSILIASVCLVALLFGTTALAYINGWSGFALLNEMSGQDKSMLIDEASGSVCGEVIDAENNHHYLDKEGNELFVLSAQENQEYLNSLQEALEQAVQDSTEFLDIETLAVMPNNIIELEVGVGGIIPDFMLGNGYMVLLKKADDSGWVLTAGSEVTIQFDSTEECYVEFGAVKDKMMTESAVIKTDVPSWTYIVPADGVYYFTVTYASASFGEFKNGTIAVAQAQ